MDEQRVLLLHVYAYCREFLLAAKQLVIGLVCSSSWVEYTCIPKQVQNYQITPTAIEFEEMPSTVAKLWPKKKQSACYVNSMVAKAD